VTNEALRFLILLLQFGFLALLLLILWNFSRTLRRDLSTAAQAEAAARAGIGRLVALESPGGEPPAGRALAIGPITSLGRNVNSTVYIEDDFISTQHALLTFRGHAWYIEDQGSTNGTWVNGHRIDRPVALSYGDEISLGQVRLRLER